MTGRIVRGLYALALAAPLAMAGIPAAAQCVAFERVFDTGKKLCSQGQLTICTANGSWVTIGRC